MNIRQLCTSRRSLAIAAALVGMVSLAIGAHAALNKRSLDAALRRNGFDVDVVEDASKDDMGRAIARLKSKVKPDSVVMLFFGGYGVQVGRESYMIPVDAAIWKEADVRRDGLSVESVLD